MVHEKQPKWKTKCRARITNSEELIEARHREHLLVPKTLKMEKDEQRENIKTLKFILNYENDGIMASVVSYSFIMASQI